MAVNTCVTCTLDAAVSHLGSPRFLHIPRSAAHRHPCSSSIPGTRTNLPMVDSQHTLALPRNAGLGNRRANGHDVCCSLPDSGIPPRAELCETRVGTTKHRNVCCCRDGQAMIFRPHPSIAFLRPRLGYWTQAYRRRSWSSRSFSSFLARPLRICGLVNL